MKLRLTRTVCVVESARHHLWWSGLVPSEQRSLCPLRLPISAMNDAGSLITTVAS